MLSQLSVVLISFFRNSLDILLLPLLINDLGLCFCHTALIIKLRVFAAELASFGYSSWSNYCALCTYFDESLSSYSPIIRCSILRGHVVCKSKSIRIFSVTNSSGSLIFMSMVALVSNVPL